MEKKTALQLEKKLSYWKSHITIHDVLASELAYSLIYDNILPHKLEDALSTVGLKTLPNYFFLIQVDDYYNYASKMRITQEFYQKSTLVNRLREYMRINNVNGFAANMIGQDKLIVFLCLDLENKASEQLLSDIAESFKKYIRQKSYYTISICISERCSQISQYSEMYPHMDLALSKSYFSGKEFSIFLNQLHVDEVPGRTSVDLNSYYPEFLVSIVRHRKEHFDQVLQNILQELLNSQIKPRTAELELIRLLQRTEEYFLRNLDSAAKIQRIHENTMQKILSCTFISDVRLHLSQYYEEITAVFTETSAHGQSEFRLLVEEYVSIYYSNTIRLSTLAGVLGFSEGHFTRLFRKEFGVTFIQYLNNYRIEQSKQLLADTLIPIEQIAYRVGINNYSYFCTCFKESVGTSPGAYRRGAIMEKRKQ